MAMWGVCQPSPSPAAAAAPPPPPPPPPPPSPSPWPPLHAFSAAHPPLPKSISLTFFDADSRTSPRRRLPLPPSIFATSPLRGRFSSLRDLAECGALRCGKLVSALRLRCCETTVEKPGCRTETSADWKQIDGFLRKHLAVFVSGSGSNFRALHESILNGRIYGDIVTVVSDKPACKACDYARSNGIPVIEFPKCKHTLSGVTSTELLTSLRSYQVDYVLLAGFLKLLPEDLIQAYSRAILNIHPALLPSFGGKGYFGRKVHEAVIRSGARFSGATIHFVNEKYDSGVILAQRVVPVLAYDTPDDLAARVLKEEHTLYSDVVAAVCEDRIFWREDGVPIIRKSWDEAEYY